MKFPRTVRQIKKEIKKKKKRKMAVGSFGRMGIESHKRKS